MRVRNTVVAQLVSLFAATVFAATVVGAQVRPPVPPIPTQRTAADSLVADTVRKTFVWDVPDSLMRVLLERRGYTRIEYQGSTVRFDAAARLLQLLGVPAAVRRDETTLIGDTIVYNDSTKRVLARGDTVVLQDPTQRGSGDFVVRGQLDYDLESRSGKTGAFTTSFESGQRLYMTAERGAMMTDTLVPGGGHIVYARNGSFTYCDHPEPHFHFTTREMKFISDNIMVARPGILYIGEVPVFWIPFFFQDVRAGRRSGILTPNFGVAELVRNSPSYRRSVSNIGYYFALSDYMDAQASVDWRSGAGGGGNSFDPGFVRGNMEWRYRWLDRFVTGQLAASYLAQRDGRTNTSYTLNHAQDFSRYTRLTASLNWTQSTDIQRQTTVNPIAANATIHSQLNYQTRIGKASINAGGTRRQYPGRTQVDMDFPSLSVTTGTLGGERFQWTPSLRVARSSQTRIDQGLQFPFVFNPSPGGGVDSVRFRADRSRTTLGFETPIKIFDFSWQNGFTFSDDVRAYPEQREIIGVRDTSQRTIRVYGETFESNFDWTTSFNLPRFFQGTWNMSPTVSVANVDPASGLFVRTERSGGKWVQQSKRLSYGLTASPTLYKIVGVGIGPIARVRHSISPSFTYSYSPSASVSDEYLSALGRTRVGYLGALAQNRVSMNLSTNIEAKLRSDATVEDTTGPADQSAGKKLTLLSLNFSPLTYDFVRADSAGNGFTDRTFSISARTDLLPGLDFRSSYELFQGDPMSDTAVFKPFRTDIAVSFSLNQRSGLVALIGRLLGMRSEGDSIETSASARTMAGSNLSQQMGYGGAAGAGYRNLPLSLPSAEGWNLSIQYNAARQRPPFGGTQIFNNPEALCESQRALGPFVYDQCVMQAQNAPATGLSSGQSAIGAPVFISPPTQNITSALSFAFTQNWSAQWSTQYDATKARFASQQVALQRQLHDWNAVFSFTQAPNGNFSFNFFIALKAQPELKFNYDRQTFRQPGF